MKLRDVRCLRGPNVWAACPVLEVTLDLGDGAWPAEQVRGALGRVAAELPAATVTADADPELMLAWAFARAALALQTEAGNQAAFAAARPAGRPGEALAAFEFVEEPVARAAAEAALRLLRAAAAGGPVPLNAELPLLRELEYQQRLPASTRAVYDAARARGIPAARLSPEYHRYLRLGQGARQHRCLASEPDVVGAVARTASTDKHLAKQLLRAAGVPVPEGRPVRSAEEARAVAAELGLPVATKPVDTDLATGVSLDLRTEEQVEAGFRAANEHSTWVLVERFAPGLEHRVLVVDDRVVAVTQIAPPQVMGDGVSTVAELVARANRDPRRGDEGSRCPLRKLRLDAEAEGVLSAQGYTPDSVPPPGVGVLVRRNPPYIMNGGDLIDLTDCIHPRNSAHAVAAAQALQIRVAGMDVVALDIGVPLEEQAGVVVEINAGPGLWLHLAPWASSPRPVGEAIVGALFPPGEDGRIPVAAVVGEEPGPAAAHLTALLARAGQRVGRVGAAEVAIGGRRWPAPGGPQERAATLFLNPAVEVAVLETSPAELLHAGFGNDRCDVAVVLDTPASPAGGFGPGGMFDALHYMLGAVGLMVLPAGVAPPAGVAGAARCVRFTAEADDAGLREHLAAGGRAVLLQGGAVALAHGSARLLVLGPAPGEAGGEPAALLAALAAGLALGQTPDALADYVRSLS